jgi:hypothetical protein
MTHKEQRKDPRWLKLAFEIKHMADFRCEDCDKCSSQLPDGKYLEVHHTVYVPGRMVWEYTYNELMCVCSDCHEWRQGREDAFRLAVGQICRHLKKAELENEVWKILSDVRMRETARLASSFNIGEEEAA